MMSTLRAAVLALTAVIAGVVGYLLGLIAERQAWGSPVMNWASLVALSALAVGVLVAGIWVYRTRTRKARRAVSPIAAVRVLVLAQAGAYVGAAWLGWHAGLVLQMLLAGGFGSAHSWMAIAQVAGGVVLVVVGYVVQALCKIPPVDPEGKERPERGGAPGVQGAQ